MDEGIACIMKTYDDDHRTHYIILRSKFKYYNHVNDIYLIFQGEDVNGMEMDNTRK